jgi:RecA-family ATPase
MGFQLIGDRALKIRETYICRQCITMTYELQNLAFTGDIDAVYEKAKTELTNLSEITSLKGKFFITKNMNDWMKIADQQPIPNMLFSELWHEYELCILFSYTGYGKSTLAMQIAISISEGLALPGFKLEAKRQKVLYFDFELSPKQLQGRYSKRDGKNYVDTYEFNPNFIRTSIDILNLPAGAKFEDYLIQELEQEIINSGVKVIIIDNLTCVKGDVESAKDAIPFMRRLNILKRTYGLSVLVLAHTPKRNESQPLSLNDLSGSSALSKFCDSCFAIGKSPKDPNIRYLIQLKEKETECLYGRDNIIVCQLEQIENMRQFSFMGFGVETDYLKSVQEEEKRETEMKVMEFQRQGKSLRLIGGLLGMSFSTVKRIIDKRLKDEQASF